MLVHCLYGSIVLSYCSVRTHKHGLVHTNTHTHTSRPEASCQVFKTSFRKNKASKIRARSLVWSVRKGGKKTGQQSTKASILPEIRLTESIISSSLLHLPIFTSLLPFFPSISPFVTSAQTYVLLICQHSTSCFPRSPPLSQSLLHLSLSSSSSSSFSLLLQLSREPGLFLIRVLV